MLKLEVCVVHASENSSVFEVWSVGKEGERHATYSSGYVVPHVQGLRVSA